MHPDKPTSVYREPIYTILYLKYNSSSNKATKDSVTRTLTRRATSALLNSSTHSSAVTAPYQYRLRLCLSKRFLPQRTTTIMNQVKKKMKRTTTNFSHQQFKKLLSKGSLPFLPTLATVRKPLNSFLNKHDIEVYPVTPLLPTYVYAPSSTARRPHLPLAPTTPNVI